MKLSARLIVYYLQQKYQVMASAYLTSEPLLKYPRICRESDPGQANLVYIVDTMDFFLPDRLLASSLVVLTGNLFPDFTQGAPNYCILPRNVSTEEVMDEIQDLFNLYETWNEELTHSRLNNDSIQDLLDITGRRLIPSNPIMLIGMDFTIIASRGTSYGDLRNNVLGTNENTVDLVNSLKNDTNYAEAYYKDGYFFFPGNAIATPQLCVNIKRFDRTVYRLMIGRGDLPLDDTFGFVLEHLVHFVSHALSTNTVINHDTSHSLHQIFTTILTDPSADYVEVSQQLTNLGWLSSHTYQCILVEAGILDARNLTLRSICSYIENTIPASCAVEFHGNAVVYINHDLSSISENEISQRLAGFIRDSMLNAGYSRKLLGHFNFQRMYVQASLSLTVGRRKNPSRWIHHFNDIALTYLLEQSTRKLPAYMLCHEKLLTLKNLADSSDSPLYQTLRVYLENHQNLTRTSEALFIHRSTLLYRLEKIRSILHSDYTDPEEVLYLLLSFRLMDLEEADPYPRRQQEV